jgi:hypothetical protein
MFAYGIDIFVIDAFNKVQLAKGNKLDEIVRINQINRICPS